MRESKQAPSGPMRNWLEHRPLLILSLCALLYLLPGTTQMPLVDRDEPRFARATVEMLEGGDWIVPYFNGDYRFDKPPLTYWWMSLHYRLLGINEFAARLHSAIACWLTALLCFSIARRIGMNKEWAAIAGLIWLGSLQVLIHGRIAVADMPLILGITLSMRGVIEYLMRDPTPNFFGRWFWVLIAGQCIAFYAKGPLAFLIPTIALLFYFLFRQRKDPTPIPWKRIGIEFILGITIVTTIVAAWGIPALLRTEGAYFDIGIGEHVVERGISSFNDRFYIPGVYYFFIVLLFFSPWVSALWPAVCTAWKERKSTDSSGLILLGWAGAPFIVFAFYKTQLPHYILPGYPALAILCARWMSRHEQPRLQWTVWINRIVLTLGMLIALTLSVNLLPKETLRPLGFACGALALIFAVLLIASEAVRVRALGRTLSLLGLISLLMIPLSHGLRSAHATVRLTESLDPEWPNAETKARADGFSEPSLVWYSGHNWKFQSAMDSTSAEPQLFGVRRWRLDNDFLADWIGGEAPQPMHDRREAIENHFADRKIRWVQGFNPGNTSWVELAYIEASSTP
jgi:4-amino-4-deoxy-L-arabinose transferase-like glycosyltransferase